MSNKNFIMNTLLINDENMLHSFKLVVLKNWMIKVSFVSGEGLKSICMIMYNIKTNACEIGFFINEEDANNFLYKITDSD